jgi:REase_DpnII-MboI
MTAKSLGEELLVDVARYGSRKDIRHLVCLVFDHAGHISNPRGLERDLSGDREGVAVTVVLLDR